MKIKVGLTGGIGCGKSTVAEFWRTLGIPVYESDLQARRIMNSQPQTIEAITRLFGPQAYTASGLNREYLASKVFNDPEMLSRLNGIVHPAVQQDFLEWSQWQSANYVIEESAILFECGASRVMDFNVVVSAPVHVRLERATRRDGVDKQKIIDRMNNQMAQEQMLALSDFAIDNHTQLVIPQILEIDKAIRKNLHNED